MALKNNLHEQLIVSVMKASLVINRKVLLMLKDYDLTHPQYNILRILRGAAKEICISEVKNRMLFDTSDVSRLVDRLVKKDLVAREVCPNNRRRMNISISAKGLELLKKIDKVLKTHMENYDAKAISLKEAEQTLDVLERLVILNSINP